MRASSSYSRIERCRICGNSRLEPVLDLGEQMLTGVFPRNRSTDVTVGPLRLVKCHGEGLQACGLLQLEHSYNLKELYGENYGYRSALNPSMVAHLQTKVERISGLVDLRSGDLVIDIGSNDATTLKAYPLAGLELVGIDPTGTKFRQYYPEHVQLIPDFFRAKLVRDLLPGRRAKVVTSFAMFYDLECPMDFMRHVHEILADDGIWMFEQSYMPSMLRTNSYDTVCHEHLEFYSLHQIKWMADHVGLTVRDVELNDVNGGSFSVTVTKTAACDSVPAAVQAILDEERQAQLHTLGPYREFEARVQQSRDELLAFINRAREQGKEVAAIGASTKGNVLLQYCGISPNQISAVGEVNAEKYGCHTPGTFIPIIPEDELLARRPDYLIVLPWHFRRFFETSEKFRGMKLVFPLPKLSVVAV